MPRDLAEALGRMAVNVAVRAPAPVASPFTVEVINEGDFYAVFLHGKQIGRIERNTDEGGYFAIPSDGGEARHVMSFARAKAVLIGDAI
jgi:hypothetical protein